MSNKIVVAIVDNRFFSQHARPSDTGLPYAENATIAVDMLRKGANRVQVDDVDEARQIKQILKSKRVIV